MSKRYNLYFDVALCIDVLEHVEISNTIKLPSSTQYDNPYNEEKYDVAMTVVVFDTVGGNVRETYAFWRAQHLATYDDVVNEYMGPNCRLGARWRKFELFTGSSLKSV